MSEPTSHDQDGHDQDRWIICCPDCQADIAIDRATGAVLYHRSAPAQADPEKNFDALLAGIDESKERANDIFQREVSALKDRDRLMEEKFREAMRRAEEEDDGKPPVRPWDLD